ncbi:MAG: membrane protein insertase YidC, partial [Elainellaceae cyanobacterium]
SLYVNQLLSGSGGSSGNPQQDTVNKITPVLFSGMFLFFPLPAGVLMYMVIANVFQTAQTFILSKEPLPENLQKILDETTAADNREALPFEPGRAKKDEETKPAKPESKSKRKSKQAKAKTKAAQSKTGQPNAGQSKAAQK